MKAILRLIDRFSLISGKVSAFALIVLIVVVNLGVIARKIFNTPIAWNFDISYMLWGFLFIIASAWTMLRGEHVRIDVLTSRLSNRTNLILDIVLYLTICIPTLIIIFLKGVDFAYRSWCLKELTPSPPYLPLYPLKTTIPVGIFLLLLQVIAKVIRDFGKLLGREL